MNSKNSAEVLAFVRYFWLRMWWETKIRGVRSQGVQTGLELKTSLCKDVRAWSIHPSELQTRLFWEDGSVQQSLQSNTWNLVQFQLEIKYGFEWHDKSESTLYPCFVFPKGIQISFLMKMGETSPCLCSQFQVCFFLLFSDSIYFSLSFFLRGPCY